MKLRLWVFTVCLSLALFATQVQGQQVSDAHHARSARNVNTCLLPENTVDLLYDTSTVTTLRGTVMAEVEVPLFNRKGAETGRDLHFTLESQGETYSVHVGPISFLHDSGFALNLGDTVQVVGSTMADCGADILVAGKITHDSTALTLRNANGTAVWIKKKK